VISDYENVKTGLIAETAVRFADTLDVLVQELLQVSKPTPVEPARKSNLRLSAAWKGSRANRPVSRTSFS
jgi:hypothetical protein